MQKNITCTHAYVHTEAITCEELSPPDNGEISVAPGPNSLSTGLRSVATYSCEPGYGPVGQSTRTCEDTNGGTVTTGTWSGTPPHCAGTTTTKLTLTMHAGIIMSCIVPTSGA